MLARPASALSFMLLFTLAAYGAEEPRKGVAIEAAALGDSESGVVTRVTLRYAIPSDIPPAAPIVVQGAITSESKVVRNFRHILTPAEREAWSTVVTLPEGEMEIEARLMIETDAAPIILERETVRLPIAKTGEPYVAGDEGGAEAIIAEGVIPEVIGALRILPPRRDLAPNLFIVDVEAQPPVRRVEFWVEGKKIFTRNAPPYRAELDLGSIPRRVEIRAIGYDLRGRYVDADAWIVNERETPLEVKITRTASPDGTTHLKVSLQNPKQSAIEKVALYAGDDLLVAWNRPPYALDIPTARLKGYDYVRATAADASGYEAADLLYLDGTRYFEQIDVNYVEVPATVSDAHGAAIADLQQSDFEVLEDGRRQKISNFGFATNLPLSVGVLVDHSGSMQARIDDARKAALSFFSEILGPNDQAFLGGFSWEAQNITPFETSAAALAAQVAQMPPPEGGTALYDAVVSGLYRFRSVPGRKALIVVTDGQDTVSRVPYDEMLTYVRSARVPIYFIGIGMSPLTSGSIKALAAETGGVAWFVRKPEQLTETYEQLEKELRSQYLLGYYTETSKDDTKYRTIEVRVARPGAKVRTIRGFMP